MEEEIKKNLGAGEQDGSGDYEKFFGATYKLFEKEKKLIDLLDKNDPDYEKKKNKIEEDFLNRRNQIRQRIQEEMQKK